MGRSRAAATQVPECRYGAACTRKGCVYKHPKIDKKKPVEVEKSDKICLAYVAGICSFGKKCQDMHPSTEECQAIAAKYKTIPCQYGKDCWSESCLYAHPTNEVIAPMPEPKVQPVVYATGPVIAASKSVLPASAQPTSVRIPKEIWNPDVMRDPTVFDSAEPRARLEAVNAKCPGGTNVLDLHYQSTQSVEPLLDEFLPARLAKHPDGIWVITGTGHHLPAQSHQKRGEEGGLLFNTVREYLSRRRYTFAIGHNGEGQTGAFLVRKGVGLDPSRDPLHGVRAIFLHGFPGSGKSTFAEALVRSSFDRCIRVSQDEHQGNRDACEAAFKAALSTTDAESTVPSARGCWWWEAAFDPEQQYLAICLRRDALTFVRDYGITLPRIPYFHATLAWRPDPLDLKKRLGHVHQLTLKYCLQLEYVEAPYRGELFEAVTGTCSHSRDKCLTPIHITLVAPRGAARLLAALNSVDPDKRIYASSVIGSFKVRSVVNLRDPGGQGLSFTALGMLMRKNASSAGDANEPVKMSFDLDALVSPSGKFTEFGDAALRSFDSITVLHDSGKAPGAESLSIVKRCETLRLKPPVVLESCPLTPSESKMQQWARQKPKCFLHALANASEAGHWLAEGAAIVCYQGGVLLPSLFAGRALPRKVVILDRCNIDRAERKYWRELGGLKKEEVVLVDFPVSEEECAERIFRRQGHLTLQVDSLQAALSAVRSFSLRAEPPTKNEGYHSTVKVPSVEAAVRLSKRWGEIEVVEADHSELEQLKEEAEEPSETKPLPLLRDWLPSEIVDEDGHSPSTSATKHNAWAELPVPEELQVAKAQGDDYEAMFWEQANETHSREQFCSGLGASGGLRANAAEFVPFGYASSLANAVEFAPSEFAPSLAELSEEDIIVSNLCEMGFEESQCRLAVRDAGGNFNSAVERLLLGA